VGLRDGLDTKAIGKTLCLCRGTNPGRPVCSHTLCSSILSSNFILIISTNNCDICVYKFVFCQLARSKLSYFHLLYIYQRLLTNRPKGYDSVSTVKVISRGMMVLKWYE
jgi:hypothetical protein